MKKGGIYNLVYTGTNEAYGRINGKRTILVMDIEPELQYVQLHDSFGCPNTDDLRSGVCTVRDPSLAFKEDQIFEPTDEREWFKHSMKVGSLAEAIERGVLTRKEITQHPVHSSHSPFTSFSGAKGQFLGLCTSFDVEDKTNQPYLQYVYVWWNTWEAMYADFKKYGVNARR